MDMKDIMGFFPVASMATKGVTQGLGGLIPGMGDLSEGQMLGGLLAPGLFGQQQQGPSYQDQYAPDQFLTGGGIQGQGQSPAQGQGQQMNPLTLLDQNINRRFGM